MQNEFSKPKTLREGFKKKEKKWKFPIGEGGVSVGHVPLLFFKFFLLPMA